MTSGNLPLQRLFTALQTAGLYIGPAERLRVQRLLADSHASWKSPEGRTALMYELAPLLCRDRTEQDSFYKAYETFLEELKVPVPDDDDSIIHKKGFWERYGKILAGLLTLVAGVWLIAQQLQKPEEVKADFTIKGTPKTEYAPGDTIYFENKSSVKDTSKFHFIWTLSEMSEDANGRKSCDTSFHLVYIAPIPSDGKRASFQALLAVKGHKTGMPHHESRQNFEVVQYCDNIPRVQDSIHLEGLLRVGQTIRLLPPKDLPMHTSLEWLVFDSYGDTIMRANTARFTLRRPGDLNVGLSISDTTQAGYCTTKLFQKFLIGEDVPVLAELPLFKDVVRPDWKYTWLTQVLAVLAFVLALWFSWRWWRRPGIVVPPPAPNIPEALRRAFESEPNDKAPYSIPYRSNNSQIRIAAEQIELANTFRRRQEGQVAMLHIPRSISATMEKMGFADLRFTYNTRPAHYLFLIDLQNEVSHQAQLFRYLTSMLEGQDVLADVFFYKNSLSRCWNRFHPEGLTLDQLALQYADRRLVVFGDGYRLLSEADEGQALHKEQADALRRWPRRMLLTPVPVASWTWREAWLYQLWAVFHADLSGLMQAARFVENGMDDENLPPTFADWERQCRRSQIDADTDRDWDTPDEHRNYLREAGDSDGAMYRWLRALAVYPELNWNVTIAIGKALGIKVRYEHLLALARIPWLQTGAMKPALWRAWMREMPLPAAAPDETLAREAVRAELRAVEELCADGYADQKMQTRLAVQDFALAPADRTAQDNLYYVLQRITPAPLLHEELDRVVERKAPEFEWKPGSGTGRAAAYLQAGQPRATTKRPFWTRDLLYYALCVPFFLLPLLVEPVRWRAAYEKFPRIMGLFVQPKEDEAIRLNNLGVEAYYSSRMDEKFRYKLFEDVPGNDLLVRGSSHYVAFHILNEAISFREEKYDLAKTNRAKIFFNSGLGLISLKYPSGESVVGEDEKSTRLQGAIARLRIAQNNDSLRIPAAEALVVAFYKNNQPDSACYWMNQLLTLKPDYGNWLLAKGLCISDPSCRKIINVSIGVAMRNREVTQAEYERLDKNLDAKLERSTSILTIPLGASVQVIDSVKLAWKVRYKDKVGFISKYYQNKPILGACDATAGFSDKDGDGIPDYRDQCPDVYGKTQAGCPGLADSTALIVGSWRANYKVGVYDLILYQSISRESRFSFSVYNQSGTLMVSDYGTIKYENGHLTYKSDQYLRGYYNKCVISNSGFVETIVDNGAPEETGTVRYYKKISDITTDPDWDGIPNNLDQCPSSRGPLSNRGCPDIDVNTFLADIQNNMAFVKGGTFQMGSDEKDPDAQSNEKPAHNVTLSDYYISRTEVTIGQYLAFCDETKTHYPVWLEDGNEYNIETGSYDYYKQMGMSRANKTHPITGVSWNDAVAYCQWLSQKTGRKYRLPTEAEWEYAARGGQKWTDGYLYSGGNDLKKLAWYSENSNNQTHPVAGKDANQLGLYDMSGNVPEWCSDKYGPYSSETQTNPTGPNKGGLRVHRSCGFGYGEKMCRATYRNYNPPTSNFNAIGFRLVLQ